MAANGNPGALAAARAPNKFCSAAEHSESTLNRHRFQSPAVAVDDVRIFEDIHDSADVVRSLAISLREAAWRRDQIHLRIHRAEFRREASLLLGLIRDIAPLEGEVAK